jgi:hypothetical protein
MGKYSSLQGIFDDERREREGEDIGFPIRRSSVPWEFRFRDP